MNITEFAEQIVFGKTLEDKLLVPGKLCHDRPAKAHPAVKSLIRPARPIGLQMRHDKGGNVQPPSDNQLENEQARGQLLHFLANHELLATELMALVLLKFPNAPHAFRQGVLVTLQEEQEHTRMYIRRMKECGVEFGRYPLSGQFWRVVEPMKSPMDFVSRLSLTFEQANLDYSLHFAKVFQKIGDSDTSSVLQQIYEDEIGHVKHGLHWFRQWKQPDQSDWEAYQATLDFPMSPQRARGPRATFNRQGRAEAGLTEDFIDSIEVFRQSRGRPPTVHWFDPAAELVLDSATGKLAEKQRRLMEQLATDLEGVMVALARQDDAILVHRQPSQSIRKHWIDAGFDVPEFVPLDDLAPLKGRNLHHISPWAMTPKSLRRAHSLCDPDFCNSIHEVPPVWNPAWNDLYRKSFSTRCLSRWLRSAPGIARKTDKSGDGQPIPDWLMGSDGVGIPVRDGQDIQNAIQSLAEKGVDSVIVKRDLATSGRGQRRINCRLPIPESDQAWLDSQLTTASSNAVTAGEAKVDASKSLDGEFAGIVEPELDRLVDLSFLWHLPKGAATPKFLGWTRPLVTPGRRYAGTLLGNPFDDCDPEIRQFLLANRAARPRAVANWLERQLSPELTNRNFHGYFGVDAMLCRDAQGQLKIKPLVELNPRITMGHVALQLQLKLASGVKADFRILTKQEWDLLGQTLPTGPPKRSTDGRWKSGVIRFCDVDSKTKLVPLLLMGEHRIS